MNYFLKWKHLKISNIAKLIVNCLDHVHAPLLFLIYINDLPSSLKNADCDMFACRRYPNRSQLPKR